MHEAPMPVVEIVSEIVQGSGYSHFIVFVTHARQPMTHR